ncbi:hypothetical protein [Streptomyces sp. NPDC059063]|uniref:hypothetical protein n=1 Tax=unclassified Streptomyces TaxID=2593676 RepID=UPI0036A7733A
MTDTLEEGPQIMRGTTTRALLGAALAATLSTGTLSAAAADTQPRAPRTERVSTGSDGAQSDGTSNEAAISGDGRYVAFYTKTSQLRGCEITAYFCVAVKDRITGTLTQVPGGGFSWAPLVFSADGRYLAHAESGKSPAPLLYDQVTGKNVNVSEPESAPGMILAVTPHARHVAYTAGDRFHPQRDLYVRDLTTGARELIGSSGDAQQSRFVGASLSADGRLVAYRDRSGPEGDDVLVKDLTTGATVHVDKGLGRSGDEVLRLTPDGRRVVFVAEGRTYVHDLRKGTTRQVADRAAKSVSGDGRYVVLAGGDEGDEDRPLTLIDVRSGRRTPVGPGQVEPGGVSAGGREVAFTSNEPLVPGDTNNRSDVYVRHTR